MLCVRQAERRMLPCLALVPKTFLPTKVRVPSRRPDGSDVKVSTDVCTICMDALDPLLAPVEALQCGDSRYQHQFHLKCIVEWYKRNGTCPTCRVPMTEQERARFDAHLAETGQDNLAPFNQIAPGFVPGQRPLHRTRPVTVDRSPEEIRRVEALLREMERLDEERQQAQRLAQPRAEPPYVTRQNAVFELSMHVAQKRLQSWKG